jgi:hypothetical protein
MHGIKVTSVNQNGLRLCLIHVIFAVLSAVIMTNTIYCAVTTRSSENQASASAGFLHGLFFDPEDGVDMLLRNFGLYPNYTTLKTHKTVPIMRERKQIQFLELNVLSGH